MRILIAALSLLVLSLGPSGARAHAFLERASPLVRSTVGAVPSEVSLTFTQKLEGAFSTVQVTGPDGARVDQGNPQVSGNTMRVGIKASGSGTYHVRWRALSVDTHTDAGELHVPCRRPIGVPGGMLAPGGPIG